MTDTICKVVECDKLHSLENLYCKKHFVNVFLDETKNLLLRPCKQYIRGCRSQLGDDYTKASCINCLRKKREQDNEKRNTAKTQVCDEGYIACNSCCLQQLPDQFVGNKNQLTKTCKTCRDGNNLQSTRRDKDKRNANARLCEAKPERKAVKKIWTDNNNDKVIMKGLNYRQRQYNDNSEEYHKRNAINAKEWRENNTEKMNENNTNKRNGKNNQYNVYKRSAFDKNINFELTYSEYEIIVDASCNYCGLVNEIKNFNGIDRLNSSIGYQENNCVSCCTMCNFMKGSLDNETFYKRIVHITVFNGLVEGKLYPEAFAEHMGCSFSQYKWRASNRGFDFMIDEKLFYDLCCHDCYICGKQTKFAHRNGIDRLDNNIGYTIENSKPCCGECNFMKRNYKYDDFIEKCLLIGSNCKNKTSNYICNIKIQKLPNKRSDEEMTEYRSNNKLLRLEDTKKRYNDEDYKTNKVSELMNKKNNTIK